MAELEDASIEWRTDLDRAALAKAFKAACEDVGTLSGLQRFVGKRIENRNEKNRQTIVGGMAPKRFADMENRLAFFTPQDGDSPFAEFDEQPLFAAGASIPQPDGNPLAVHMHLYGDGDGQRASLQVLWIASFGSARRRGQLGRQCLAKIAASMRSTDSAIPAV